MSQSEERERERLAAIVRNEVDAAPVLEALRGAGFFVESIADLFNKKMDYRSAVPTLVEWLSRVRNPDLKQDIVRALSVKWARHAAPLLIAEFERADDLTGTGLRWAIGNALEVLANDEITDGMIKVATDRRYGRAREMVVVGLGKLKDARVTDVLLSLLGDDEVVGHAVMALGRLHARAARSRIEPLLKHPKGWVRKEAKKALTRIDKR